MGNVGGQDSTGDLSSSVSKCITYLNNTHPVKSNEVEENRSAAEEI